MIENKPEMCPLPLPFLTGIIAPMYTPFDKDGNLDLPGVREMIKWLKSRRVVRSVFVRSGVGQMYAYRLEEAKRVFDAAIAEANGEIGILAGCAGESPAHLEGKGEYLKRTAASSAEAPRLNRERYTAQSIELARFAKDRGADAAVLVLPWVMDTEGLPLEDAIFGYYRAVHDAVEIPIVIYQAPGIPDEFRVTPSLLRRLLTLERISGMKVTTTDPAVFAPISEVVRGTRFALIAGAEHFYFQALQMGACGVIGGGCSTHPELIYAVQHHFLAGNMVLAEKAAREVERLIRDRPRDAHVGDKMYILRKGVKIQPYGRPPHPLPDDAAVDRLERFIDEAVGPYRRAIQGGTPLP